MDDLKGFGICGIAAVNMFLTTYVGVFIPLLYLTVLLMVFDLITRVYAASVREDDEVKSKKVLTGIKRKLGMGFLIILSLLLDFGLIQIADTLGITVSSKIIFTALTLARIFVRELISNLENLQYAGIDLPPFVTKALDVAKDKVDQAGDAMVEGATNENISGRE